MQTKATHNIPSKLVDSFTKDNVSLEIKEVEGKDGLEYVGFRNLPDGRQIIIATHVFNVDRNENVIEDIIYSINKKYTNLNNTR